MCVLLGALSSCAAPRRAAPLSIGTLEAAPSAQLRESCRTIVSDPQEIADLCRPLGPRMDLVQVHTNADWARLQQVCPDLGPAPDLARGAIVGVLCRAGTPLSGEWPIELDRVRVADGAGFLSASFVGGSYLPDGVGFLEAAYVEGLSDVMMVDVNGVRFFAD
ncbi:MAG: hypothetical protein HZB38_04005 [Planctomycetes bacterium]|nr:hypothetical protein [Planctomycetota bacterium]